jgi:hypothetical protein
MVKQDVKVKSYVRKGKLVKQYQRKQDSALVKATIVTASTLGLTAASYLLLKRRYINGYKTSAKEAFKLANNITPVKLSDKVKRVHFTTGGFNASNLEARQSISFAHKVRNLFDKTQEHIIPVNTSNSNVKYLGRNYKNKLEFLKDGSIASVKPFIKDGYNPTARELAADMYSYAKTYPDKDLVLHGFSSGSFINSEAINIFKEMGGNVSKVKQINYAGTYLGINKVNTGNTLSFGSKDDWDLTSKYFPYPDIKWIKGKNQHTISEYVDDKNIVNQVKQFIGYEPLQIRKVNKAPINVADEIAHIKDRQRKLKQLRFNTKIPESKKKQAMDSAVQELNKAKNRLKMAIDESRRSK